MPVSLIYPWEPLVKRPKERGAWNMKVKPFHNSATCLPRQFLIKGVSASVSERKILMPFAKDGIRLGRRNVTEVWILTQMTNVIFFMTQTLATPQ